jgi:hypothetical protein
LQCIDRLTVLRLVEFLDPPTCDIGRLIKRKLPAMMVMAVATAY